MPCLVSEVDCRDGVLGLRKYVEKLLKELVESLELTSPSILRGPVKMAANLPWMDRHAKMYLGRCFLAEYFP